MTDRPKIVVIGSLNVDHTLLVPRIPAPGETLTASGAMTCFGGKGANQAVAAARAGGAVTLIGCVGDDDAGAAYLRHLEREGINIDCIRRSEFATGSAFIAVDNKGENCIIVNPGANYALTPADIDAYSPVIQSADAVLLQLECPLPSVIRAIGIANAAGVKTMLNPSPWSNEWLSAGASVSVMIVNEQEAQALTGSNVTEARAKPAATCAKAHCELLIITRGADTTLALTSANETFEVAPPKVQPVDTVGAGDTFAGALAVALKSNELAAALKFANTAGALATLKPGAQAAIPPRQEILERVVG